MKILERIKTSINLKKETIDLIDSIALRENRNRNQQIQHMLEEYLKEYEKKKMRKTLIHN